MLRTSFPHPTAHHLARSWAVASVLACASLLANALTLGPPSVESALGQPLRAAIEITQYKTEDLRKLKVQLAGTASFEQAGMAVNPALDGLQARLEFRGDGKPYIALSGQLPVTDHFVDVIVEAQWPSGRLAMNYTLLVSPVGASKVAADKLKGDATLNTAAVAPQALAALAVPVMPNAVRNADDAILVRAGDTASKLVLQRMPAGVSLDQMLLAMVRANPEAFIEGNVNLLREGAQVVLPNAQEAAQISAEEARQTVIAQTVDFVAYARRLGQATLKATDSASDEARLAVEREIQDKTEQLAALKKNLDTLKSLSASPDTEKTSPEAPSVLKPTLPTAAAEVAPRSLLEQVSHNPFTWAWVMALLAAMLGSVWFVRRNKAAHVDLFGGKGTPEKSPASPPAPPVFASGLPPQFAHLDLNLTPSADAQEAPKAFTPPGSPT